MTTNKIIAITIQLSLIVLLVWLLIFFLKLINENPSEYQKLLNDRYYECQGYSEHKLDELPAKCLIYYN